MSGGARRCDAGSALVEALVALVLIAMAGLVVATAATNGLRATHRAATLTRTTALAARELARLASQITPATTDAHAAATVAVAGFRDPAGCATDVTRDGNLVDLAVAVDAGHPPERVVLTTQRLLEDADR